MKGKREPPKLGRRLPKKPGRRARKKRIPKTRLAVALLVLFAGQLVVGSVRLTTLLGEYAAGEDAYAQLHKQVQTTPAPTPTQTAWPESPEETGPPPWPQVDFQALAEINPDVVGWITVEGTGIDYPIVQTDNNKTYLKRLFDGKTNRAGCIFLDCGNAGDFSDANNVIYGHHLRSGTMFSPLLKYKDQTYYDEHPTGWLLTPEKVYLVRFFTGFVSDVWGRAWDLDPAEGWAEELAAKSRFSGGPAPEPGDRVLTLSTCAYDFTNARFVLLGVLEEQET